MTFTMIDLCAGTGAFSLAFENTTKVRVVYANDMVKESKQVYDANFEEKLSLCDLHSVKAEDVPPHDILTAGFSCQPFSVAGKQEGFDDERSNIFWKIVEIVKCHRPSCILLENVKNLATHNKGQTFKTILDAFTNEGYHIKHKVLDTCKVTNTPQHRERIYIACFKHKTHYDAFEFDFAPVKTSCVSTCLERGQVDPKYYYTNKLGVYNLVADSVTKPNTIYQLRRVYVRENKNGVCPTLTANMGTGGHNVPLIKVADGIRKLTPRECFNFQGFPETYVLPNEVSNSKLYKLAGNAVSYPVVQYFANVIVHVLSQ